MVLVLLHPAVQSAAAHELSLLAGTMQDTDTGKPSYAWQLEYRRWMTDRFAVSLSYLNRGVGDSLNLLFFERLLISLRNQVI